MSLNRARSAAGKHSFGEQVIEHGLSAKIITSILTEWPFHRLTKKRLSKHGTGGTEMTVIEFAEKRLNESCLNDDDEAVLYWRAYLDGARAQKKEYINGMDKREYK